MPLTTRRHPLFRCILLVSVAVLAAIGVRSEASPRLSTAGMLPGFLGYNAYYGELHQHTGYSSDGCGLPEAAILAARARGNSFIAITEHRASLPDPAIGSLASGCRLSQTDPAKWSTLQKLADKYTHDGLFVVLRGFEHTRDPGHLNVFNSQDPGPLYTDLDGLYSWLAGQPADVLAQFNHPFPLDLEGMGDFDDFGFFPPAAPKIRIMENNAQKRYYASFPRALAKEWQVSSVGYGDGHMADQAGTRHYGIFASSITKQNLIDALRNGRTFGNTDGQLAIALVGNGRWMGSAVVADRIVFQGYAADSSGDTISKLELIGRGGVIALWEPQTNPAEFTFSVDQVQPGDFFYLHAIDSDGDHAWSGSITRPRYRRLQANPATLRFSVGGTPGPAAAQTFFLEASDGADLPWQASALAEWVSVSPARGEHLPALVTVTVRAEGLPSGSRSSALAVETLEGSHVPIVVGVQEDVGTGSLLPLVNLSPRVQSLATTIQEPVLTGTVSLSSKGTALTWFAAPSVPWLSVSPATGCGSADVRFRVDLSGYPADVYVGHIVATMGAQTRVAEIRVALQPLNPRSLTLQNGAPGYGGASDTYLDSWAVDTPAGGRERLLVRTAGAQVPLVRFDLSGIPQDSEVFTGTLSLYAASRSVSSTMELGVYEVLKPWDEMAATWRLARPNAPWAAPGASSRCAEGADTACRPASSIIAVGSQRWYTFDITSLLRRWVAHPEDNFGLALVAEPGVNMNYSFPSDQSANTQAAFRPLLSLVYGDSSPTPTATASPTPTATPMATVTPTATEWSTPTPTATALPIQSLPEPIHLPLVTLNAALPEE